MFEISFFNQKITNESKHNSLSVFHVIALTNTSVEKNNNNKNKSRIMIMMCGLMTIN
jgi:hypothetical protein